ncbi:hypothetical protein [Paracoccus lutimaris]|uniref:Uncharacterized protein n=1 Tax=Paracoccus lutimaris TaxID=1490030 RepID=A0A368Z7Y8_9RHOB|nr:hypothetical protein [Paracoccus lutimaris]RCW88119.1 hypothetical protein DFP89_10248 [Paracoccus lutimaris]
MTRTGTSLLILATLGFIASSLGFALHMDAGSVGSSAEGMARMLASPRYFAAEPERIDLSALFLHPQGIGMKTLLVMTWAALAYHALRNALSPAPAGAGSQAPLIGALALGAVWPWLVPTAPILSFLLAGLTLVGLISAAMQEQQHQGHQIERSSALGFAAGWGLLVWLSMLAALLQTPLGLSQDAAAVIAILIGSIAAVRLQLRLGRRIGFSVALIWGLIGIAAGTVTTDATIATVTVLAIAIIAVALVRVTT